MQQNQQHLRQKHRRLFEGLRADDLRDMVSDTFSVDQYKSKMGNDEEIIVISFVVNDKFPAIDLMEFIEKGYPFVLDADMSAGEEHDGQYRVFVEIERKPRAAKEVVDLLQGVGRLCGCEDWNFRYFRDSAASPFSEESFSQLVPLTVQSYKEKVKSQKVSDTNKVLNQGPAEATDIDESNNLTISKPYAGNLVVQLESVGDYNQLSESLQGGLQLDQVSNSQLLFLEKYLGNYEIHKIDNKFILRNGNDAMIFRKDNW